MVQDENKTYFIADEEFVVNDDGSFVEVSHPRWSLNGIGKNISEAVMDLYNEAEIVQGMFLDEPVEKLSPDALKLRDFLTTISKKKK